MASSQQYSRPGPSRPSRRSIPNSDRVSESIARSDTSPPTTSASQTQRNDESWVEVASQPSSSSLSSIGDEIVTTGLRVGAQSHPHRRRRLQHHYYQSMQQDVVSRAAVQTATSSQDECTESESEDEHVLTSSTENMGARTGNGHTTLQRSQTAIGPGADLSDSDDDNGTALGRPSPAQGFRPQPNAFTHPPAHLSHRSYSTSSAIPPHHPAARTQSYSSSHRSHNRVRAGFMSPAYQNNEDALRASLTTLLSCAAAAKNLPGRRNVAAEPTSGEPVMGAGVGPGSQPMELRLVQESELGPVASPVHVSPAPKHTSRIRQPATRTTSNSSAPVSVSSKEEKGKRAASTSQPKSQRAAKKKRVSATGVDDNTVTWISPATLTWVLGTGVVLLVSVVGFGAGFVVGREVGRQDILHTIGGGGAPMSPGANTTSCGGEVIRSTSSGTLRRWRWGSGMGRLVSA
ncbi:hypothetical protein KVR01_004975 [Diaporthe batatas]|uniref:uncharacterized protein n=1 Tax=Diaporthe batatas TaxID=748121 RepID=UPI001D048B17|nr:uncharacterized protein KVR01_004975 [Diaporthe batatas]KAG8164700.1 hypothetical protein KVR01_004975 [Diaporthe batatas]